MKFVIFHGSFGTPEGNWFTYLKNNLESLGQSVIAWQFPYEDEKELVKNGPSSLINKFTLENWFKTFEKHKDELKKGEKLCFIGHSLGCLFILRLVDKYRIPLDSAIFVGPFLDCLPTEVWPYTKIIPDFQKTDFDSVLMKKLIPSSYVLYSDDDPYVLTRQAVIFAKVLDSSTIRLKKAGHMNLEVNLDEFSLVLDLCLSRLDLSYTKKYNFIKRRIGAFEYVYKDKSNARIIFDAQTAFKEKMFNFQDVKKTGFATQFTGFSDFYEPHSDYMEYSRRAAKRISTFVRVILVEKNKDLKEKDWQEQIRADIESGIRVYLCPYDEVKGKIPEPDFGIWDNNHVVVGKFDWKTRKALRVVVDNSPKILKEAKRWEQIIMKYSIPVYSKKDIDKYVRK